MVCDAFSGRLIHCKVAEPALLSQTIWAHFRPVFQSAIIHHLQTNRTLKDREKAGKLQSLPTRAEENLLSKARWPGSEMKWRSIL